MSNAPVPVSNEPAEDRPPGEASAKPPTLAQERRRVAVYLGLSVLSGVLMQTALDQVYNLEYGHPFFSSAVSGASIFTFISIMMLEKYAGENVQIGVLSAFFLLWGTLSVFVPAPLITGWWRVGAVVGSLALGLLFGASWRALVREAKPLER